MRETDKYIFFWGHAFSQWAIRPMTIDGVEYNCCEQYMMAEKAKLFGDTAVLAKIMAEKNPERQKSLGREVRGFVEAKWNAIARDVVYKGNYHKFSQNADCRELLKNSGDKVIVEASPTDTIWGIGLSEWDARATDPKRWRGTNWLGECIMKARDTLRIDGKL